MAKQKNRVGGNADLNRKVAVSSVVVLIASVVLFYLGNRYGEIIALSDDPFSYYQQAFADTIPAILANPLYISMNSTAFLIGLALVIVVVFLWAYYLTHQGTTVPVKNAVPQDGGHGKKARRFLTTATPITT